MKKKKKTKKRGSGTQIGASLHRNVKVRKRRGKGLALSKGGALKKPHKRGGGFFDFLGSIATILL